MLSLLANITRWHEALFLHVLGPNHRLRGRNSLRCHRMVESMSHHRFEAAFALHGAEVLEFWLLPALQKRAVDDGFWAGI